MRSKRVWIDLDNTPHVPFFLPIIRELERAGHTVLVTARDAFQVRELAAYHGLACSTVGRHYGANRFMKVAGTLWRAAQLAPVVLRETPDVSVSHGSRPLVILSAALRIPSLLLFDYEFARRLPILKPTLGMAPEWIGDPSLARGFRRGLRSYTGLKEDVYTAAFRPTGEGLGELGVNGKDILVTVRPPATEAHYHNPEAETLFSEVVEFLGQAPGVRMVIVPRGVQRETVLRTWPDWCRDGKIVLPPHAVNGLDLIWHSDLVVSGGGTMNREAAALGVPVYTIFRGKLGAVDRYLAEHRRLVVIERREDVRAKVRLAKRERGLAPVAADRPALRQILAAVYDLMELPNVRC